jgi:hypothetical protein
MHEVFPVLAGIAVAGLALRVNGLKMRLAVLVGLSLVLGVVASAISGELALSWGFVSVDTALVLLGAATTTALVMGRKRLAPVRRVKS